MNKKLKLLTLLIPTVACLAGCDGPGGKKGGEIFTIMYYPGGYGTDWIVDYAKAAIAEERGISKDEVIEGTDFKLVAENEPASDRVLKSKKTCPDLIFSNGFTANLISSDLIESIEDVYATKVQTSQGEKTIQEYLIPDCMEQFRYQKYYGQGERLPYGLPLTNIPISIAYNETLLRSVVHVDTTHEVSSELIDSTTNCWLNPPTTVEELQSYFADLTAKDPSIIKLGWSMADGSNWFEPLYATWWAQAQGVDKSRYSGQGSYYDFWETTGPEIYEQTGIQVALKTTQDLFVDTAKHEFKNSHPYNATYTIKDMQAAFARGEMAMCLTGDFFENEYKSILKDNDDVFKLMRIPSIEGAEKVEGTDRTKKLTFVNTSNVLFIPKNGKNKELAKKFLIYSCQEEQVLSFLELTGGIRPFQFDKSLLEGKHFTAFQQSTLDLYFDRDDLLLKYPRNAKDKDDISPIYIYEDLGATLWSVITYPEILTDLTKYTPEQIAISGAKNDKGVTELKSLKTRSEEAFDNWKGIYRF